MFRISSYLCISLVLAFVLLLPSTTFSAESVGTIVLKSGERFEELTYRIDSAGNVLTIVDGDWMQEIHFAKIDAIYDADGNVVTNSVMNVPGEVDTEEPWVSESSDVYGRSRTKRWNVGLGATVEYNFPSGHYYEGTKGGIGFGTALHVAITHEWGLRFSVDRQGTSVDGSFGIAPDPNITILAQSRDINATRLLGGAEYFIPTNRNDQTPNLFFLHSSLGVIIHSMSTSVTVLDQSNNTTSTFDQNDTDTRFTMTAGVGFVQRVSRHLALTYNGDADFVWTTIYLSNGTKSTAVKGFVMSLSSGLMYFW